MIERVLEIIIRQDVDRWRRGKNLRFKRPNRKSELAEKIRENLGQINRAAPL